MSPGKTINVVFVVFDDVTQLDFTGPAQCLSCATGAQVFVAAESAAAASAVPASSKSKDEHRTRGADEAR